METINELLAAAAPDPRARAWDTLYEAVRHAGLVESDRDILLRRLPGIAVRYAPADRDNVLMLAGQIAAELDEAVWPRYEGELAELRALTGDWLPNPVDSRGFVYRLQAVMALDGDTVWGAELERIGHDEIEVECPRCWTMLFVVFGADGHFATDEDYATTPDVRRTALLPAEPASLTGAGQQLHILSMRAGQQSVADALLYLFGRATCPQCGETFRVADQVYRH